MKRLRARNQNGWLVKTSNGEYQAHWYEYILDPSTGKTKRRHRSEIVGEVNKMRKCDAEKKLRNKVTPMNDSDSALQDGRVTLNWFLDQKYIPAMKGAWRDGTLSSNLCDINYLRTSLGEESLQSIDLAKLNQTLEYLARTKKLSESTVARVRIRAKSILAYASEMEFIRRNPAESKYYRMPLCRPTQKPYLSKAQIATLWTTIMDVRDRLIVLLAGTCGIRESELFGLAWECVHPDRLEIRSTGYRGKLQEFQVKREASHRNVPIPPEVYRELKRWREQSKSDSILVFPSERTGGVMWPGTWLQKRIKPLALKVGIKNVNFRMLRRSFATLNADRLKAAQTVLGHSSIAITGDVYAQGVEADAASLVKDYYGEIVKAGRSAKRSALAAGPTAIQ